MGFNKQVAQEIQELGMIRIGQSNVHFVEWENDERIAAVMYHPGVGAWWEIDFFNIDDQYAGSKLYDGKAQTPYEAVEAINKCISDNALGLTIETQYV